MPHLVYYQQEGEIDYHKFEFYDLEGEVYLEDEFDKDLDRYLGPPSEEEYLEEEARQLKRQLFSSQKSDYK